MTASEHISEWSVADPRRFLGLHTGLVDSVGFNLNLERKLWNKPYFEHGPMGNSFKERAVLSVGWIRHKCLHFQHGM